MDEGSAADVSTVLLLPSEPRPVRLMNTVWADRGGVHDALGTPADLGRWLAAADLLPADPVVTAAGLRAAISLRDALRRLAALRTADSRSTARSAMPDLEVAVWVVNEAAAAVRPDALDLVGDRLRRRPAAPAADPAAALATVAVEAIALLTEPDGVLNACTAPGCVLYFVKDHPRREWCSAACGNRARAARHYQRHRAARGDS
ncbi:ABATE domain-containing protein [Actinoplanes oblitus]|uniref:ABATE domain-containing protein n=1 Tax=Actinoplanes oblitus TaxID=3040509 RepID=A0ABY8WR47_9ACTN|nr:ABATE domain-containing protein [Actinoplanes oblitus]WIM99043.1 ABATE domain-containing protein [Actinoplanes oblitus]